MRRWFLNPYVQLGFGAFLVTASELLLKKGAINGALASHWTWLGIGTYVLSFGCWLYVLRHLPLSVAYGLITIVQVLVPLGAWMFLGETIAMRRWIGIGCVLCGTILIARSAATVEDAT